MGKGEREEVLRVCKPPPPPSSPRAALGPPEYWGISRPRGGHVKHTLNSYYCNITLHDITIMCIISMIIIGSEKEFKSSGIGHVSSTSERQRIINTYVYVRVFSGKMETFEMTLVEVKKKKLQLYSCIIEKIIIYIIMCRKSKGLKISCI